MPIPFVAAGLIGAIGSLFGKIIATRLGQWIVGALIFLGIEFAVSNLAVQPLMDQMTQVASGLPGEALQWARVFKIDVYVSIILSAYAAAAAGKMSMRKKAAP